MKSVRATAGERSNGKTYDQSPRNLSWCPINSGPRVRYAAALLPREESLVASNFAAAKVPQRSPRSHSLPIPSENNRGPFVAPCLCCVEAGSARGTKTYQAAPLRCGMSSVGPEKGGIWPCAHRSISAGPEAEYRKSRGKWAVAANLRLHGLCQGCKGGTS